MRVLTFISIISRSKPLSQQKRSTPLAGRTAWEWRRKARLAGPPDRGTVVVSYGAYRTLRSPSVAQAAHLPRECPRRRHLSCPRRPRHSRASSLMRSVCRLWSSRCPLRAAASARFRRLHSTWRASLLRQWSHSDLTELNEWSDSS